MSKRTSILPNFCLASLLTLPAAVLIGFGAVFTYEAWEEFRNHELGYFERVQQHGRWMQFRSDGTPIVRVTHYSVDGTTYSGGQTESWETLDGERLPDVDRNDFLWGHIPRVRVVRNSFQFISDPFKYQFRTGVDRIHPVTDPFDGRLTWRPAFGQADACYYEASDPDGNVYEFCGQSGFTTKRPVASDWFRNSADFRSHGATVAFRSGGEVVGVDFQKRVVVTFAELGDDQPWTFFDSEPRGEGIMVMRGRSLTWFDLAGHEILQAKLQQNAKAEISFVFKADGSPTILNSGAERRESASGGTKTVRTLQIAHRFDESGTVIQTHEFQAETRTTRDFDAPWVVQQFEDFCSDTASGFVLPSPGALALFHYAIVPAVYQMRVPNVSYEHAVSEAFALWPDGL